MLKGPKTDPEIPSARVYGSMYSTVYKCNAIVWHFYCNKGPTWKYIKSDPENHAD